MRAKLIQGSLLVGAAAGVAVAFALAAAPHEPSETGSGRLRMPAPTGRSVVQVRPAPGRPDSSPGPILRAPAAPAPVRTSSPPVATPRPRARIVIVPGVILTRAEPARPGVKVIPVPPKRAPLPPVTRELAEAGAAELVHDRPAPPRPHE